MIVKIAIPARLGEQQGIGLTLYTATVYMPAAATTSMLAEIALFSPRPANGTFSPRGHAGLWPNRRGAAILGRMVIGYHVIFGAYGFWLPNDPRGSWSTEVWAKHLRPFGTATKVTAPQSLAHREHNSTIRLQAKQHLKYPAVQLNGLQARAVGRGFAEIIEVLCLKVLACSIMPDHVHMVTARHSRSAEELAGFLKRAATRQLSSEGCHPLQQYRRDGGRVPSPWADGGWYVYLNTPEDVQLRIRYVEENPVKAGLSPQQWPFVIPCET